ncbi:hypothetical protein [Paenibacillus sp. FSL K6-1318]|uniref:hypothetical protein n=1 Tax=Paenibacillus sp. FSL K6-1318 TaxID=2975291 RepID=UPI0030ECF462
MNAYFYNNLSREIGIIINDIQHVTSNEIKGRNDSIVVINPNEEISNFIVTDKLFEVGDILPIDEKNFVGKYIVETPEERMKRIEESLLILKR